MKELPQLVEATEITGDYWNEYWHLEIDLDSKNGRSLVTQSIREHPVKRYEERYPPTEYGNVVTEKNRERVLQLNQLATKVNAMTDAASFRPEELISLLEEVNFLIYGCHR